MLVFDLILRKIFSTICSLIPVSSGLQWFMGLQLGLFLKFVLLSLRVICFSLDCIVLILSLSSKSLCILFALHCDLRLNGFVRFRVLFLYIFSYEVFILFFIEFIIVVCLVSRDLEVVVAFDLYKYIYILDKVGAKS